MTEGSQELASPKRMVVADCIARELGETTRAAISQIQRIVYQCGSKQALAWLEATHACEATDAVPLQPKRTMTGERNDWVQLLAAMIREAEQIFVDASLCVRDAAQRCRRLWSSASRFSKRIIRSPRAHFTKSEQTDTISPCLSSLA